MRCFPFTRLLSAATLVTAALVASPSTAQESTAQGLRAAVTQPPRTLIEPHAPTAPSFTTHTQEWRLMRSLLSPGDLRKLDLEFVRFDLQSQFLSDPERDPFYDRTRDTVRGSYLKVYKEILRRQYPIDELLEDAWANRASARIGARNGTGDASADGSSWRVRVSPRVAIGSNGYLGARLSLPNVGNPRLERMALNLRHGVFEDEWAVGLRYSGPGRFLQLERVDGDPESGDRYTLTVAMRF